MKQRQTLSKKIEILIGIFLIRTYFFLILNFGLYFSLIRWFKLLGDKKFIILSKIK